MIRDVVTHRRTGCEHSRENKGHSAERGPLDGEVEPADAHEQSQVLPCSELYSAKRQIQASCSRAAHDLLLTAGRKGGAGRQDPNTTAALYWHIPSSVAKNAAQRWTSRHNTSLLPHGHCPWCHPLSFSAHGTVGEEGQPPLIFLTTSQLSLTRSGAEHTSVWSHRRQHEPDLSALEVPIWDHGALIALCNFQQRLGGPINYCLQNLLPFLDERFDEREQLLVFLVPSLPLPNTLPLIVRWCLPNLLSAHMVRPKSYYLMIQSDLRKSCNFLYKA